MAENYESVTGQSKDSKVEIYLNNSRNEQYQEQQTEIDLLNVLVNMKNTRQIFLWLTAVCMVIGMLFPYFGVMFKTHVEEVSAVIGFQYDEASEMLTPDGRPLDVNMIASSNIVAKAIENTGIEKNLSVSAVSNNLTVSRMLTEDAKQRKEIIEKLISANISTGAPSEYINDLQEAMNYTYKDQYVIKLKNGFGESGNFLSEEDLVALLNNIIVEYKKYFFETYGNFKLPENSIDDIRLEELDYIEWLDNMVAILDALSDYCTSEEMEEFKDYRSVKTGFSFGSIDKLISLIKTSKVDYLYSYVYYNCLAKEADNVITKFNYSQRALKQKLDVVNVNIENGTNLIENYKINNILINRQSSSDGEDAVIKAKSVTDYYNNLVLNQAKLYAEKAELQVKYDDIQDKINGFSKNSASAGHLAIAETEIKEVNALCRRVYNLVNGLAEEIASSETFAASYVTSVDATGEGGFFSANLKKIAMGGGIGLVISVALWGMFAFIKEIKDSTKRAEVKKNEK